METAIDLALSAADEYKRAVANGGIKNLAVCGKTLAITRIY
jgi:hypothetical protein